MIHIHCNLSGFMMLAIVFLIAIGVSDAMGYTGEGPAMIIAGPLLALCDLGYRLTRKKGHWIIPKRGGSLFFVPVWCWGVVWLVLGIVYTVRPTSA